MWLNSLTGNYGLTIILFIFLIRFLLIAMDYYQIYTTQKTMITAPYIMAIRKKYLGKDKAFEDATYELFKISGTSQFTKILPLFFQYPIYVGIFYVIYNPISVLFEKYNFNIDKLFEISSTVNKITLQECSILSAVQTNPELFEGIKNIGVLSNLNTTFLGINVISPVTLGTISIILPIITIGLLSVNLIKMIKNFLTTYKGKSKINGQLLLIILMAFITVSIASSAFYFPVLFHIYYYIFFILGILSKKLVSYILKRFYKKEFDNLHNKCEEIAEKYNLKSVKEEDEKCEEINIDEIIDNNEHDIKKGEL